MSLLDQLREAQDEPARLRASPYVGPSILTVDQLRAMERALAREGFFDRGVIDELQPEPEPEPELEPAPAPPAPAVVEPLPIEPLPIWTPPEAAPQSVPARALPPPPPTAEPLPIWTPPSFEPAVVAATLDPCPNCGEELQIDRIDLTTNASWLSCRPCGMRWGGSIDLGPADRPVLPALAPG